MHLRDTDFWHDLMHGVYGPRNGGARIIVDAEDAATGVGKTTAAVALARACAKAFDYELSPEDFTLSGQSYLERWREHPGPEQPSAIVLDELAGAGAGDARRSMSTENVNLGRSWQLMRKKRIVTICTLPHWSDADKRMRRFADFRVWCLSQPIGYFRPYRVTATFDNGDVRTESYDDLPGDRLKFPNLEAEGDELFQAVTEKKDDLLDSTAFDANELQAEEETVDPEEVEREQKLKDAQNARDMGLSTNEIADLVDMSQSWVCRYTDSPDETAEASAD
jgi:hypothetical protein